MRRFLSAVAGLTLAAVVAAPASAQSATDLRPVRFGVQGGLSMPMGDFGDFASSGYTVGGLVDWRGASMPFGVRFNVDYSNWGGDSDLLDVDYNMFSGTAAAMFTVPTTGGISPYVLGGVGMYSFGCSEDCDRETEFGFNVGGGLNFNLGTMDTFAEIRYHDAGDASFVPIVFGIRF